MREWALGILRCPRCGGAPLRHGNDAVSCPSCTTSYGIREGITDFLIDPNPIVDRERAAVEKLDEEGPDAGRRLRERLERMETGQLTESDQHEFPCLRHALEGRAQILELLEAHPLSEGDLVVELGADHCWTSSVLLDAGCRVVALDLTDHLRLAARGSDPRLCRLKADMNRLPLDAGVADVVWATAAAHHSWDLRKTFSEAARVLKKDGRLVFCCEPLPSWPRYVLGRNFGQKEREMGINECWTPRSTWVRLAVEAGFRPQLVFPSMGPEILTRRLKERHLPAALAPLARPFLKTLQVSIHLLASRA
jgi:SAM-dependent methyltransferase